MRERIRRHSVVGKTNASQRDAHADRLRIAASHAHASTQFHACDRAWNCCAAAHLFACIRLQIRAPAIETLQ
jgi:hypothetical protein